ncbi:MAG: hypothetical protein CMH55_07575 [Myxococcales bacterium]|nr:hypothetical protein [Myxococcales bacterium]|tara:strand:- start:452 stop:688 length:237 start_codon:yes stop_codon:yes gene_type:complete
MAEVKRVTIEIGQQELLNCIWYSDGSGAYGPPGLGLDALGPDAFDIEDICLFNTTADAKARIAITIVARDRAQGGDDG